jgi:mRNA-degrading endonuclease YafQ of YafQ-DinJ toxin-antitoxin module
MYLLKRSSSFEKSLKKLLKKHPYASKIISDLKIINEGLAQDPSFSNSTVDASLEPLSEKILSDVNLKFWKIRFTVGTGKSGKIRLMYLVNNLEKVLILVYIYDHKQYTKRPLNDLLKRLVIGAIDEI